VIINPASRRDQPMQQAIQIDGEIVEPGAVEAKVLPGALRVIVIES
jgi:diacylglycerol kinase family enzyme